ncbi:MAG: DUF5329 family protein [Burkholderiaceae bacterium]
MRLSWSWPLRVFIVLFCINVASPALAAASRDTVSEEVAALLSGLSASTCLFYRNGRWHEGPAAATHLQRKFDYIAERRTLQSTEEFIELGASESSFSGRAYQVRCGQAEPQSSQSWLLIELAKLRQAREKPAKSDKSAQ